MLEPQQIKTRDNIQPQRFKWLSGWSRLVLEMLAITFGVLLAFGLNAWWEGRTQAEFDRVTLSQVYTEIDRNFDNIEKAYQYRLDLYPKILAVDRGEISVQDVEFQGTRPPRLETAAYDLALASGVFGRIDPEDAQTLVKTYLDFDSIDDTHELYASSLPMLILQMENRNDPKFSRFMKMAFLDMIFAEGETLNQISSFSEKPEVIDPWTFISNTTRAPAVKTEGSE